MALFGKGKQVEALQREVSQLRDLMPAEAFQGETSESPFVTETTTSRSLLPWRRRDITEAATVTKAPARATARAGFMADIPWGGANEFNQGYTQIGGVTDRKTHMEQLQQLYAACVWSGSCVDVIARTTSAGGLTVEPDDETDQREEIIVLSPQAQKAADLIAYVNPNEDIRQLLRMVLSDLMIYGDSFIEVVWALGEPIAMFTLPCPDMLIDADEHGVVGGYIQRTDTNRRAQFEPHQVIHIKFDSPRGGLYGMGPTEKTVHSINTWLFTKGLQKSTMKRGNPPNLAFQWDINLSDNEIKKHSQQYMTKNIGPDNVGNPIEVKGDNKIQEFFQNRLADYESALNQCRDEILGGYGVPPAEASIIESGNLGGGTGTSQRKSFMINTCGPPAELVLEKLNFHIMREGFGVTDFEFKIPEIDWRDDAVIEEIRTKRVERAGYTINRYRDDIGEPPVDGGDDAVIIQTRDVVLVKDLAEMSKTAATKGAPTGANETPGVVPTAPSLPAAPAAPGKADSKPPAHATTGPTEAAPISGLVTEADGHTGAMVALFVPSALAASLEVPDGEPAEDMHVTLAYLGDAADLGNLEDLASVVAAWAIETPPIASSISGVGLFNPQGADNPPVTYASVDAPHLSGARHRLVEQLKRAGFPVDTEHGFTPHITLAYSDAEVTVPAGAFTFGAVTLSLGDERQTWPLTGQIVESAPALVEGMFEADFQARYAQAVRDLPKVDA